MLKYIALLRGINVGGHRKIKMVDLKNSFEVSGFNEVETYIQSGNVIFTSKKINTQEIEKEIESFVYKDYGHQITVLVITEKKFIQIYDDTPFSKKIEKDIKSLYVIFLSDNPNLELFDNVNALNFSEEIVLVDQVIYIYYPIGLGKSKLTNNFLERKFKVITTARNWNTVTKLRDKLLD